jgi:hypothetical protein
MARLLFPELVDPEQKFPVPSSRAPTQLELRGRGVSRPCLGPACAGMHRGEMQGGAAPR